MRTRHCFMSQQGFKKTLQAKSVQVLVRNRYFATQERSLLEMNLDTIINHELYSTGAQGGRYFICHLCRCRTNVSLLNGK